MEIGAEISKKIRSAIKAKLVELGAYVDEELPDYIMVMVANKKRREHMVTDLGLFLGNNAEKFANWLHDLLNKLQAISSDKEEKKKPSENKKPTLTSSSEPSNKTAEHLKRHSSSGQEDSVPAKSRKTESASSVGSTSHSVGPADKPKSLGSAGVAGTAMVKPLPASSHSGTAASRVSDADEEPLLQVQADTDEFSEELLLLEDEEEAGRKSAPGKSLPAKAVPVQAVRSTSREEASSRPMPASKASESAKAAVATKAWSEVLPTPKPASSQPQASRLPSQSATAPAQPSVSTSQERSSAASRKRKAPTSVVGSVKKTAEEEEEEYDPYNPAVGSVASVVKVTARKSSVPTALQANKSLLLKAVSDAEKSILSKRSSGTPTQAMIRPIPRDGGDLRDRLSAAAIADVRSRLSAVAAASDARTRLSGATSSPGGAGVMARPTLAVSASPDGRKRVVAAHRLGQSSARNKLSAAASHDVRVGVKQSAVMDARSRLPPSTTADKESRLQTGETVFVSTSRPNPVPATARLSQLQTVTRTIDVPEYIPTRKAIYVVRREEDEKIPEAPDSRVVELGEEQSLPGSRRSSQDWDGGEEGGQEEVEEYRPEEVQVAPIPEILTDNDLEDYSFIEDEPTEQESSPVVQPLPQEPQWQPPVRKRLVQEKAKSGDTKFIVTLDGVNFDDYDARTLNLEDEEAAIADRDATKEESNQAKKAPPKIKPFSINLKDSDDELEQQSPRQTARSTERCRFWPACMNGNACEYHHPTQPCKTFPNCKFGDKCLFIHPNCKFDSRCSRPDCPYTHASRRHPIALKAPQVISIPHHGIPMIVASPPQRPVPCRFFPNCTNVNCSFYHPKPCRYGSSCLNKSSCSFFHPALPSKDKLKWTASGAVAGKTV